MAIQKQERKIFESEDESGEVMQENSETGMSERPLASRSSRNFSTYEANSDERVAFSDNEAGERIARMDEVRRFRYQKVNPEVKETVLLDTRMVEEAEPGRDSFCYTGNPMQVSEGSVGTQIGTRYGIRNFSKNSRRMEAEFHADAEQSFGQTQRIGREIRKTEQKAREAARDAQHTAREAGKTVGKTVSETVDSISQYSELVTRPYENGKRTFSAGKETVSKQFQSVKEMASSAKDADETIGSRAKEILKAMAVRTFREAVTLPVRLARAAIKTATTMAATISTGGINLIIMLIALILAGAVLVSMIVFAGTMLIAYGVSEGLLSF